MSAAWSAEHAAQLGTAHHLLHRAVPPQDCTSWLYRTWYAAPRQAGHDAEAWAASAGGPDLPPADGVLRAAHGGADTWHEGTVLTVGRAGTAVVARPASPPRAALRGDYVHRDPVRRGLAPVPGDAVLVRARYDAPADDGWWRTWGRGWDLADAPARLTRLYLAVSPDRAPDAVHAVTTALDQGRACWSAKVVADRADLARPDAMVVYLPVRVADLRSVPAVATIIRTTVGMVRDCEPPLTLRLAPGIAAAEDPGDGRSFGEHVCRLVAATGADPAGASGPAGSTVDPRVSSWLDAVAATFRHAGLDPAAPYLRALSGGRRAD